MEHSLSYFNFSLAVGCDGLAFTFYVWFASEFCIVLAPSEGVVAWLLGIFYHSIIASIVFPESLWTDK